MPSISVTSDIEKPKKAANNGGEDEGQKKIQRHSHQNYDHPRQNSQKDMEQKDFDPTSVGLSEGFKLTDYARLKG
jgi:hypothetical protein